MAIPFLSNIRLPSAGKVYLWTGHNDNFLKYDLWQASASAGMTIKNIANSGSIIFQTNSTTALTLDSSQNVIANAFTGKLQGAVTGAPDTTIWRVSGEYTNWGIFYNEGSPDKIEFKAAGTVTSSIALDNGNISTTGSITATSNSAVIQTPRISMEADGTLDWGQTRGHGTLTWDTGKIMIRALSGNSMELQTNGSTPALTLDASQNATFAGNVTTTGVAYTDYIQTRSGTSIDFRHQDASVIMRVDTDDARVGIGTTSPNEKLTVNGNVESLDTFILNYNNAGNKWQQLFDGANGWNLRYYNGSSWSSNYINVNTSGNATFNGSVTAATGFIADAVSASNNDPGTDNVQFSGYGMIGNRGNLYITNASTNSAATVQIGVGGVHNGSPKLKIGASTSHILTNLLPGTDSTYNIGSSASRFSNIYADTLHGTVALSSEASNLGSFDDRDMAPEDMSFSDDLKLFFVEKSGIEGGTVGSNWQDALFISSYVDASGGNPNLLTFDKSEKKIYHYQASATATSWGTPKELAYTSDFVKRTGGSSTSMSGDLHIIAGAPKIYLQDSTDDDDQQIIFRNNGGSDEYKIATQDFTSAGTGDGLFIGSETSDPVKLVTNDTIALAIDSSQHVSLPGAYLTLKDINSHAQIEASSSSLMLKAVNIQAQGNFIPDGSGNRSLGSSGRYWSETYTNGVTSGGNIVINSNTPTLTLGVINSSTGNAKIQLYSKNSGTSNGFAIQYNKDTNIDRLEFIDGGGTAAFQFHNGGNAEFEGSLTASQINTGQGATEVHLMNQNVRTSDNVQFADLTLTGNLNLYGDINTQNVTNLDVTDKVITVGKGQNEASSGGSGLLVDGSSASILWDESNDTWDFNKGIDVGGDINVSPQATDILIGDNLGAALEIKEGSNLYMRFNTTNGGEKIEINKPVEATFINASTGFRMASGQAIDFVSTNIGYNSIERNTSVGGLQINTGDTNSMNILDNGNVGLNTTSPEEKLTISTGNVQFRKSAQAANTSLGFLGWKNTYATGTHVAAKIDVLTRNESSNAHDFTNLVFSTWNGYNSLSEKMRIADDGNVGIGYDNPYKKLHLHNPTDSGTPDCQMNFTTGVTEAGDGNGFRVGWNGTVGQLWLFENAGMRFGTNNGEKMRISAAGNVGIGDTSPTSISANTFSLSVNSSRSDLTGALINKANGTIKHQQYWDSGGYAFILTGSSGDFKWNFGSSEKMRLTETGRVGIGNTTPLATLTVGSGTGSLNTTAELFVPNNDALMRSLKIGHGSSVATITTDDSSKPMAFNSGGSERIRILSNGRVGIGLTDVKKDLEIEINNSNNVITTGNSLLGGDSGAGVLIRNSNTATNTYANLDFRANNADGRIAYQYTGTANQGDFHFVTDNTSSAISAMVIKNDGKIGMGTTSPLSKLHIDSSEAAMHFTRSGQETYRIIHGSSGLYFSKPNSGGLAFGVTQNSDFDTFNSSGNTLLRSDASADRVGIGTTSPEYKLSVAGAISGSGFVTYTKSYGSLNATGNAVAGITANANGNGSSCGFTFTCFGHTGAYQRIVYSCYNGSGTWYAKKVIDEGTNQLDVAASADGSTITFTFKATSATMYYTPRVKIEAEGQNINSTYA